MTRTNIAKRLRETKEKSPEVDEDRLSQLPDAILTQILLFIPTMLAIRMTLLSKRWRHIWSTIPAMDFFESREIGYFWEPRAENNNARNKFFKFMDECLSARTRRSSDTNVARFRLEMRYFGATPKVDRWLHFLAKRGGGGLHELDLSIVAQRSLVYLLPGDLLGLRDLTILKLTGVELKTGVSITLPCLRESYLVCVHMEDQVLTSLLSGCPSLETLHVKNCYRLLFPKFLTPSLRALVFINICRSRRQPTQADKVENDSLEYFKYDGKHSSGKCLLSLESCPKIKVLSLTSAYLSEKWLECLINNLSLLESLSLTQLLRAETDHHPEQKSQNPYSRNELPLAQTSYSHGLNYCPEFGFL